jgi:glycosyltransferase involved in cell wall biosynthesis
MTESSSQKTTAVIPAYNEEKTIASVVTGALKYVSEVLVVDDGSVDRTVDLAMKAGARVISIPRNIGKGHALSIGLTTAALNGSEIVVCLDSDGQHDPDDIPKIVEPIADGRADMVIGSRFLDAHSRDLIPAYRRVGQGVLTIATNMGSAVKITDSQSGYRAFRRDILRSFDYVETGMGIESEMVRSAARRGLKIEEVPITAKYDGLDTSTLKPGGHGMTVLSSVIRAIRSEHPLLYFGVGGLLMTIVRVVVGLYSIEQYISVKALPFGPSLLAVMLTALGILFVLVGLILNAISAMVNNGHGNTTNDRGK